MSAFFTGFSFKNPPNKERMNPSARLLGLSKIRFCKVPRSSDCRITRSKLSSG